MSVIKLVYGQGQAAAFFDLLSERFVAIGPEAISSEFLISHPSLVRIGYKSHSFLSGEVVMANSGLISKVGTYRPQCFEFPCGEDVVFPLVPVDRNDVLSDYPVIYSCSIEHGMSVNVVSGDVGSPIVEGAELDESLFETRTETLKYRNAHGRDMNVLVSVKHYGQLTARKFYACLRYACRDLRHNQYVYKVDYSHDRIHPTELSVWLDENDTWFLVNEYGLMENVGSCDPVEAWATSGIRPKWAPTDRHVLIVNDDVRAVITPLMITYYGRAGQINFKYLNVKGRIDVLKQPDLFLNSSHKK